MAYESDYLAHYGVLGMKWGVRKNPQRAYEKAEKKFNKLTSKSDRQLDRAGRYNMLHKKVIKVPFGTMARYNYSRAQKNAKRASKWLKKMEKTFSNQPTITIDPKLKEKGSAMLERYRMMRVGGI